MKDQLKTGSILSYMSVFFNIILSLFVAPITVEALGQAQYGLYQLIWSFVGYLNILDFGISNAVIRYIARFRAEGKKEDEENFLGTVFIIYLAITLIIIFIGVILYNNIGFIFKKSLDAWEIDLAKRLFIIMLVNLIFNILLNIFPSIINALEHFVFVRSLNLAKIILRPVLTVVILSLGANSVALAILDTALVFIFFLMCLVYVLLKLKVKFKLSRFDFEKAKELFSYSFFIFLAMIVDQVNWKVDQFFIGILMDTKKVALYSIAISFPQYFMSFALSISGVFLPRVSKMDAVGTGSDEFTDIMIKSGRIMWFATSLIPMGFILFGKEFLALWLGNDFLGCYVIAIIIMLPLSVVLSQSVGISILQAKNKHAFRSLVYLAMAAANCVLTYILIQIYGLIGAAFATSLSLVLGNILIMNWYYYKKIKINIPKFFKKLFGLLPACLLSLASGVLINFIRGDSWIKLGAKIFLFIMVYGIFMYFAGLNSEEKRIIFGRLIKKRDEKYDIS
mgnify:CR=1 FL=1